MIQKTLTNRKMAYNITKYIITLILAALMCSGCSSDSGSSGPIDSDGDGVIDSEDRCPNTPPGNQVNPDGCSSPRFMDMGDGTVRDNETGLLWLKESNALEIMNWYDAMDTVASMGDGDYGLSDGSMPGDWRLPMKEEWEYFFHPDYIGPPISNTFGDDQWVEGDAFVGFIVTISYYWSGTTFNGDNDDAWLTYLARRGEVFTYPKTYVRGFAWPVREDY